MKLVCAVSLPALFCGAVPLEHTVLLQVGNRAKDTHQVIGGFTQSGLLTALKQKMSADDMANLVQGFSSLDNFEGLVEKIEKMMFDALTSQHNDDKGKLALPETQYIGCEAPINARFEVQKADGFDDVTGLKQTHHQCRLNEVKSFDEKVEAKRLMNDAETSRDAAYEVFNGDRSDWNQIANIPVDVATGTVATAAAASSTCAIRSETIKSDTLAQAFIIDNQPFVKQMVDQWGSFAKKKIYEAKVVAFQSASDDYEPRTVDCLTKQSRFEMASCNAQAKQKSCREELAYCHETFVAPHAFDSLGASQLCDPMKVRVQSRILTCQQTKQMVCMLREWGLTHDNSTDVGKATSKTMTEIHESCQLVDVQKPSEQTCQQEYALTYATSGSWNANKLGFTDDCTLVPGWNQQNVQALRISSKCDPYYTAADHAADHAAEYEKSSTPGIVTDIVTPDCKLTTPID